MVFFQLIGGIVFFVCTILLQGLVFCDLWSWFIVPLGLANINIAHSLGILVMSRYMTFDFSLNRKERPYGVACLQSFIFTLIVWGSGAVYHYFM